ncbi:MAG: hypothetical protein ACREQ9_25675, partial [Candidatus Binatia bacterium]
VFVLIAVLFGYQSLSSNSAWRRVALGAAAGLSIVAGMLVKGPAGAFVLILPLAALAACRSASFRGAAMTQAAILGGMLLAAFLAVASSDDAIAFVTNHLRAQIAPSLAGLRERQSRLHVFEVLFAELGVPLLVCLAAALVLGGRPAEWRRAPFVLFLLLGLAGSLPFVASPKQPRRYVIPSLPFFSIALGVLFGRVATRIEGRVQSMPTLRRGMLALSVVLLAAALAAPVLGRGLIGRKDKFHADFRRLSANLEPRTLIQVCPPSLMQEWGLHANFQRSFKTSLTAEAGQPYYLRSLAAECQPPAACTELLNERPRFYALYRCEAGT